MKKVELLEFALKEYGLKLRRKLSKPEMIKAINKKKLGLKSTSDPNPEDELQVEINSKVEKEVESTVEPEVEVKAEIEPTISNAMIDGKKVQRVSKPKVINKNMYRPNEGGISLGEPHRKPEMV